jgi:hypothetical protein
MALIGALAVLAANAQIIGPLQNSARGIQPLILEMANQTGGALMVEGLPALGPPVLGIPNAPLPPGPIALTLNAGAGLPAPFYQWVSAAIDGKGTAATLGFRGVDASGKSVRTALYSDAKVSEVGVPELNRKSSAALTLRIKTSGTVKPEPAATDKKVRAAAKPDGSGWRVSGFRVVLGDLSTAGVERIGSFSLTPGGALALTLTLGDETAVSFGKFALTRPGALLDGELQLISSAGQALATIPLQRVQVGAVTRGTSVQSGGVAGTGTMTPANYVTLRAGLARILFAPQIAQ